MRPNKVKEGRGKGKEGRKTGTATEVAEAKKYKFYHFIIYFWC